MCSQLIQWKTSWFIISPAEASSSTLEDITNTTEKCWGKPYFSFSSLKRKAAPKQVIVWGQKHRVPKESYWKKEHIPQNCGFYDVSKGFLFDSQVDFKTILQMSLFELVANCMVSIHFIIFAEFTSYSSWNLRASSQNEQKTPETPRKPSEPNQTNQPTKPNKPTNSLTIQPNPNAPPATTTSSRPHVKNCPRNQGLRVLRSMRWDNAWMRVSSSSTSFRNCTELPEAMFWQASVALILISLV